MDFPTIVVQLSPNRKGADRLRSLDSLLRHKAASGRSHAADR
ncbi:MAG: hypothetical protein ABSD44_01885 [Terracidiphilus sp.]